jgi:UDP-hydrolysing UDP-N-acetyl-D-glucosamine 2-epimerase
MGENRKICIVTGSRAEYGHLYWLMKEVQGDKALKLQIAATGMHLSPEFGLTYKIIEQDGFEIDEKVEMLLSSDTPVGLTKSTGLATIGFADAFDRLNPDVVVLLGDRFELLAAAQAALIARIPLAHISGGELTEGVIDESIRHSITKMSQLHFVAAEEYRKRVIQLGEQPDRVFNVGDPGLDYIERLKPLTRQEIESSLGFKLGEINFLVTYHPVTLSPRGSAAAAKALLAALDRFPDAKIVFTKSNSDTDGRIINQLVDAYAAEHPHRAIAVTSLGQARYLSVMKLANVVVGNSSSGIVEAPCLKAATVNIGDRQRGRLKATSVIDCDETTESIGAAITKALTPQFRATLPATESLYGACNASSRIKELLKTTELDGIITKTFYDIPPSA